MTQIVLPERGAEILFGDRDENIKLLESLFDVRINARGSRVTIEGTSDAVDTTQSILVDFSELVRQGYEFSNGELQDAFRQIAYESAQRLSDLVPGKVVLKIGRKQVKPRSPNQLTYVQAIEANDLVFGIGPAGTGKTFLAVAEAVAMLTRKEVARIVLTRPAVEAGERLGFLPGDMQEKVNPYLRPLYDALHHMLEPDRVQKLLELGVIEVAPIAFMRGRTLSDAFIILDEAQNTTSLQMKMFLTRMGLNSKAVVTGDTSQIDLPDGERSGLVEASQLLDGVEGIAICTFDRRDVVRHRLVRLIVDAYDRRPKKRKSR